MTFLASGGAFSTRTRTEGTATRLRASDQGQGFGQGDADAQAGEGAGAGGDKDFADVGAGPLKLAAEAVDGGDDAGGVLEAVGEGVLGEGVAILGQSDGADAAGGFDGEGAEGHGHFIRERRLSSARGLWSFMVLFTEGSECLRSRRKKKMVRMIARTPAPIHME